METTGEWKHTGAISIKNIPSKRLLLCVYQPAWQDSILTYMREWVTVSKGQEYESVDSFNDLNYYMIRSSEE